MAAFKKLTTLSPELVAAVDDRLLKGEPPSSVAAWLQDVCNVMLDIKRESLKKNLERYRDKELKNRVVEELKDRVAPKSAHELRQKLNAQDALEELAYIQRGRLDKLLVKEKGLPDGILLNQATAEVRLMKDTLESLGRLQLETGTMRRAAKTINGSVFDPTSGETKQFSWTEEQEHLMQQIESLSQLQIPDAEIIADV